MKNLNALACSLLLCLLACKKTQSLTKLGNDNISYQRALDFRNKNEVDSAFVYFSKAKDVALAQKDSLTVGKSFSNLALILFNKSDYLAAEELSLKANSYYNDTAKMQQTLLSCVSKTPETTHNNDHKNHPQTV